MLESFQTNRIRFSHYCFSQSIFFLVEERHRGYVVLNPMRKQFPGTPPAVRPIFTPLCSLLKPLQPETANGLAAYNKADNLATNQVQTTRNCKIVTMGSVAEVRSFLANGTARYRQCGCPDSNI